MKYYRLDVDKGYPNTWYLDDSKIPIAEVNALRTGQPVDLDKFKNAELGVDKKGGVPLDYSQTTLAIPVISEALADVLYDYGSDIQLIPVTLRPAPAGEGKYYILVIRKTEDCVDESRSNIEKYEEFLEDFSPENAGLYRAIISLKIYPGKLQSSLFLLSRYTLYT